MIGHVSKGASFFHCISYCLEDKLELTEAMKEQLARIDNLQHKDRAEVLEYNKCFGNKYELAQQFRDVQLLSKWAEKPVLHLSLRLAPGDNLTREQFIEIGREAVKEFDVADHQYICILHKDTNQQHIHIVANRVGFDGKVAKDGNSYKRMATLCRRLERQYNLQQVLSPRAFLSERERLLPRHDKRKDQLREDIQRTLKEVSQYSEFEKQMTALGYKVIKGPGICFIDNKMVKIKGSEVGFSLMKIERILALKQEMAWRQKENLPWQQPREVRGSGATNRRLTVNPVRQSRGMSTPFLAAMISKLLEPIPDMGGGIPFELTEKYKKKKRKRPQI
jgi:hypothetical protein